MPGDIDQLMYIKVDTELVSLMQTIESQSGYTGQPLASHLSGVQSLLVGQFIAGDQPINLLFIEANKEASITDLQQIGVIATEDTYASKKLNSHTWVYGDTSALAYLAAYN